MTKEDAGRIVAYMNAAFPNETLETESHAVLVSEVALLHDANVGQQAAQEIVQGRDRFPTIREFRAVYHAVVRRLRDEHADTRGLDRGKSTGVPEWVHVWWWIRRIREPREERPLPQQQDEHGNPLHNPDHYLDQVDYDRLRSEWVTAGSPKMTIHDLAA